MNWETKQKRNSLLFSSDWTQLSDNALTLEKKQEWADYRQKLRDLSAQDEPIIFPLAPQPQ
jgi:hypothetical protein